MIVTRPFIVSWLITCGAVAARAEPPPEPEPEAPRTAPTRCDSGPYFEPSVMVAFGTYKPVPASLGPYLPSNVGRVLNRLAAGALLRLCDPSGRAATHLHVGLTGYISNLD